MKLGVSYKSQWDSDAGLSNNDCGPCCLAMVLNYYGENLYTDEVFKKTGASGGLISIAQLQKAIGYFGYSSGYAKNCNINTINDLLKKKIPAIALIRYAPLSSRQDKGYKGGHFVVITGIDKDCFIINDPDFYGNYREHGHHHRYLKKEFLEAWGTCHYNKNPNNSLLIIYRKEGPMGESAYKKDLDICLKQHNELVEQAGEKDKEIERLRNELKEVNADLKREVSAAKDRSQKEKERWQEFKAKVGELLGCAFDEPVILSEIKRLVEVEDQLNKVRKELKTKNDELLEQRDNIDTLRDQITGLKMELNGSRPEKNTESEVKKMQIPEKFTSRKFLAMVGAVLAAIGTALTGQVEWSTSLTTILIAVMGYLGVEGAIDLKTAKPNTVNRK